MGSGCLLFVVKRSCYPDSLQLRVRSVGLALRRTANLRTKILHFRGFDSSVILILRGGILMSLRDNLSMEIRRNLTGVVPNPRSNSWGAMRAAAPGADGKQIVA